jgi:hypothetical protein
MIHKTLNKKLFDLDTDELRDVVKEALLTIADKFISFSKVPCEAITDVIVTGSNMNYNYTHHSDLDVHVVIDKRMLADGGIVDSGTNKYIDLYLASQKQLWNSEHGKIRVRSYPVEMYFQDVNDILVAQGQYSLLHDQWVSHPKNLKLDPVINIEIRNQGDKYEAIIDGLIKNNADDDQFEFYKDKFRDFRKTGLASPEQEASLGNLLFKELRNRGVFDRMTKFLRKRDDQSLSLEAVEYKNKINDAFREALLYKIEQALVEELGKHYEQPSASGWDVGSIVSGGDEFYDEDEGRMRE